MQVFSAFNASANLWCTASHSRRPGITTGAAGHGTSVLEWRVPTGAYEATRRALHPYDPVGLSHHASFLPPPKPKLHKIAYYDGAS